MLKFHLEYEQIHFTLEVSPDPSFQPLKGERSSPQQWEGEKLLPYSLIVTSSYLNLSQTHYFPGLLLREKEESMLEDLEYYLDQEGLMDKIQQRWKIIEDEQGPSWKKSL